MSTHLRGKSEKGFEQPTLHTIRGAGSCSRQADDDETLTIMKTTAAHLSALYLLLFALCAILVAFYIASLSASMLTAQTNDTLSEKAIDLAAIY